MRAQVPTLICVALVAILASVFAQSSPIPRAAKAPQPAIKTGVQAMTAAVLELPRAR